MTTRHWLRLSLIPALVLILWPGLSPAEDLETFRKEAGARRARVMERLGPKAMLILFSNEPKHYTGDVDYEFRQENNLFYLTGITQEDVALVLMPGNERLQEILFLPRRDPAQEVWTGHMLSAGEGRAIAGIENIWPADQVTTFANSVLNGRSFGVSRYFQTAEYVPFFRALEAGEAQVYLLLEDRPGLEGEFSREWKFAQDLRERFVGIEIRDVTPIFANLRLIKSEYELAQLQEAMDITIEAQKAAWRAVRPGMWEYEVEAIIEYLYKRRNAFDWGFPSIVASGPNATTLHYQESQRQMQDGELLLLDVGAEYNYYTADITRTIPVSGEFSPDQATVYQIVLDAQNAAIEMVRPGVTLPQVHQKAVEVVRAGLRRLGLITDVNSDQYRHYFMHGTSHYLGMDVHDVGDRAATLKPGMVFTIEPGIYVREDVLDYLEPTPENQAFIEAVRPALDRYVGIGVRIEDDILVTRDGYRHVSADLPREIPEIEALMAEEPRIGAR